jgi:GDP-L-fucose synthase
MGMVGSAIVRLLIKRGFLNLSLWKRKDLDLRSGRAVLAQFRESRPEYVFLAAAKVGGIQANIAQPADFISDNLLIQASVIEAARMTGVKKLLFLGSSCMYPRDCPQPMSEDLLLSGPPEPTNRAYAIAKIAGMEMCRAYRQQYGCEFMTAIPCNVYGPGDHYEPERAHVIPALIERFKWAKCQNALAVDIWGSGFARREFLHVDDLAAALLMLMDKYDGAEPVNVGSGEDHAIHEIATMIRDLTGYRGAIVYQTDKPDGAPRKLLDSSRIDALRWYPLIPLEEGLRDLIR